MILCIKDHLRSKARKRNVFQNDLMNENYYGVDMVSENKKEAKIVDKKENIK